MKKIIFFTVAVICFIGFIFSINKNNNVEPIKYLNFKDITMINVYSSKASESKNTKDSIKIKELNEYITSIKANKINKSSFKAGTKEDYYYIDMSGESGLLYQLVVYDNTLSILDLSKPDKNKLYLKIINVNNKDFMHKYMKSL